MFAAKLARRLLGEALGAVGAPGARQGRDAPRGGRDPRGSSPPYRPSPQRERDGKKEGSPYRSPALPPKEPLPNQHLSATSRRPKTKPWGSDPASGASPASSFASPAPLSRPGVSWTAKARRALVPFVALCGLILGSALGGALALRFSGKCSASAAECWDLRNPRPRPSAPVLASPGAPGAGGGTPEGANRGTLEGVPALSISDFNAAGAVQIGEGGGAGDGRGQAGGGGEGRWQGQGLGQGQGQVGGGGGMSAEQGSNSGSRQASGLASSRRPVSRARGGPPQGAPLVHVLPDEEDSVLLARAVKALTMARRRGRQRLALLFISRGPLPLAPLWASFLAGHQGSYSLYVHTNPGFTFRPSDLPPLFHIRHIRGKGAKWGAASMVDAMRRLLAVALGDPRNTRFVFLSESCIPVYDFERTQRYLMSTYKSFVRGAGPPPAAGGGTPAAKLTRWTSKYLPLVPREQWRKGSKWVVLTRRAAGAVVKDTEYYPLFRKLCTYSAHCYPEEHYMQTMLHATLGGEIENRSVTWVDWSRGGPSSMAFARGDVGEGTVARVRGKEHCELGGQKAYCYLFARKFRNDTLQPLLDLEPQFGYS